MRLLIIAKDKPSTVVAPALILSCAAALQIRAFWPGIVVWDSIRQYRQALTGRYDDWHPPAMNWLWRQLLVFGPGPASMMVLQVMLYWGGFALLAIVCWQRSGGVPAAVIPLCALLPVPLLMMGIVLKDSLMAGALLAAAGLLAVRRPRGGLPSLAAAALLIAAATLRFNAVPACLPLLMAALPAEWKRTRLRAGLAAAAAAIALLLALPVANRVLGAERSGVELSLVAYDLGGITKNAGVDAFPPLPIADPVAVNARCYSPVSWDSYSWWVDDPCPIQFEALRGAFARMRTNPYAWLATAIAAHPLAYARHRLAHFNRNLRFWVHDDTTLPALSLQSDPNPWGLQVPPNRLRALIAAAANWSLGTPLAWPACWLALSIGVLMLGPMPDGVTTPLAWSAALYGFSYLPLSVASEIRYHVWTILAAAIACVLALGQLARGIQVPRWRRIAACVPFAIVMSLCIMARVFG